MAAITVGFWVVPVWGDSNIPENEKESGAVIDRTDFPPLYVTDPPLRGEAVWMVQARLRELGYDIEPDGIYTAATGRCVALFQISVGLPAGTVMSETAWIKLMNSDSQSDVLAAQPSIQPPQSRKLIIVDIATHKLTLYEDDQVVITFPISVGKSKTPSPLGEWKVVQKSLNWGNGFGTRWLGLNVPWGIYGIHGTNKPGSIGSSASHGCIRMFNRDVEKLYPMVPAGTTVRIVENGKMFPDKMSPVNLKKNDSGQKVVYVQSRLKELGIVLDRADGRFGNMTELAVKYFQIWHDLRPSGQVDKETYQALGMIK